MVTLDEIDSSVSEPDNDPWVRVRLHADRLDWIPPLLITLNRPFIIESPAALSESVQALAHRLLAATTEI
ncbi:hypothetical protein [Nocardia sp. NPDC004722]